LIEQFNHDYDDFFAEPSYQRRWDRLRSVYLKDYGSFRVLFLVETMGLLDHWREPTSDELTAILRHKLSGGQVAIRIGNVIDLFQPVWPLEVAKYEYLVHRATWDSAFRRRYFMTSIRSFATALVQTWWAFETLMNDFASIIVEQRRPALDQATLALLEEKRIGLDKTGAVGLEPYNQPLLPRLQFIYRLLTGEELDRSGQEWQRLVALKDARDAYVHRIGKAGKRPGAFDDDSVVVNGFASVRSVIAKVFTKTPEFAAKFAYKYLAFWSCGSEAPFIWDGREGDSFYLGTASIQKEAVAALFAPMPGSFAAERIDAGSAPSAASAAPAVAISNPEPRKRRRRRKTTGSRRGV
jgi:hypothetical protein